MIFTFIVKNILIVQLLKIIANENEAIHLKKDSTLTLLQ